jgi:uncharacterized protein (TIGR02099 family)
MTVSPAASSFLRRAARWLAALAALAALGFATAAALMFFWVLPNIADHRETVSNLMSRALGQRVTLDAVSGVWQQARPEFRLQGVHLYDRQGRPALYLPELRAAFAWRSLLFLEPRFNHIELQGLSLDVRRARDGHFYVGGIPVNPSAPDSNFSNWLLRQGEVHVARATVNWMDEVRDAPPLLLTAVDFKLNNHFHTHAVQLSAFGPASLLARPLTIDAQFNARNVDDIKTWTGVVKADVAGLSFQQLACWLALPYQPRMGTGALHLRFDVVQGALARVGAGFDLRSVETTLGQDLPALRVDQVRGQAVWQRGEDGQRVAFENVQVARPRASLGAPFNMGLAWNGASHVITAQAFGLGGWGSLLPSLPMDAALRARLQALQPQGRLDTLRFEWTGAQPGLDNFSIATRFSGLGVAAVEAGPGLANVTGRIEGDARAGMFEIDSKHLELNLPNLFREPLMGLDTLQARGRWAKTTRGRLFILEDAAFSNQDAAGSAKGRYELIPGHPGMIDMSAKLTRADGRAVYRYLPKSIGDITVDWARQSVIAGYSDDVELVLRGDLAEFPFAQGSGLFRVDARIKDAVIDYVEGWPRIDGIHALMQFNGSRMEVSSDQARIYGVALSSVRAVIPDLLHHDEELLLVDGEANGPIQDFIRFTNFSPVGDHLRGVTDALDGSGPMLLALKMRIPLQHAEKTSVAGKLSFQGDTLFPAGRPRLEQVRGDIDFTSDGLTASNITAQFLGGPMRVDASTRDSQVEILARGRVTAAGIAPWLGATWGTRLSGQASWQGQIDMEPAGERVRIVSDLVGLGSSLPAPLAKAAAQALPLLVTSQPQADGQLHEVRLGKTVGAVWRDAAGGRFNRGEIRFGGPAVMPAEPGLRLTGSGRGLDFSGWLAMLPGGDDQDALSLSSIELSFDTFDLMGRRYQDIRLQGRIRNGLFRTQVNGRDLNGVLTYRPAGDQPARVSAQFKQFTVPERFSVADAAEGSNMKASDFPLLDVTVEDFRLQDTPLGRLEAVAHSSPQGIVIDSLKLTAADSLFRMSGLWRASGLSETRADLSLSVTDAGKFLARFGFPDTLKRGSAEIQGNATWEGSPADFSFRTLAGQLEFKARDGQFLKIEPGVGKLLGVLSLQSLPRRLSFDFRDIFNEGFAFDDISATLRIARGVVYSDNFKMRGPSAKVNMSGLANLNQESVQLRVKVIPKLSEGVAVAGALIAGPLAGVGALAAQKLLRDPLEEAISQEYMVTGPWLEPDVKRLTRANAETQANEP